MIIWHGAGPLVLAITFCCSLIAQLLTDKLSGTPTYWQSHSWPFASALFAAAPFIWCVGRTLERRSGKVLIDPETNSPVRLDKPHDFFVIPMKYWGAILLIIATVVLVTNQVPGPPRVRASDARTNSAPVDPAK